MRLLPGLLQRDQLQGGKGGGGGGYDRADYGIPGRLPSSLELLCLLETDRLSSVENVETFWLAGRAFESWRRYFLSRVNVLRFVHKLSTSLLTRKREP